MTAEPPAKRGRPRAAPIHLTQAELAARWQLSERTLDRWRAEGKAPVWLRLNGRIRYRLKDVLAFERLRLRLP